MNRTILLFVLGIAGLSGATLYYLRSSRFAEPVVLASTPSPTPVAPPLAVLQRLLPPVIFRRALELSWNDAQMALPLFENDALKTQERAAATIVYQIGAGSTLSLRENTHIILSLPGVSDRGDSDRGIVQTGEVTGSTPKELWLMTARALLRLRAKEGQRQGRGTLALSGTGKIKTTLHEGQATLYHTSERPREGKFAGTELTLEKPLEIELNGTGKIEEAAEWAAVDLGAVIARQQASVPLDFSADLPVTNSEINRSQLKIRGKVTALGGKLMLNGKPIPVREDLRFETDMPLSFGANVIVLQLDRPDTTPLVREWVFVRRK